MADDETAATPVKAVFADIRATTRSPLVNLIFRRLAREPALLESVWATLRPLYAGKALSAWQVGLLERIGRDLGHRSGKSHRDGLPCLGEVSTDAQYLVQSYLSNNARNLLAFRWLLAGAGGLEVAFRHPDHLEEGGSQRPLPSLPRREALPMALQDTVARLNRLGDIAVPRDMASFYLHLTHWPRIVSGLERHLTDQAHILDFCELRQSAIVHAGDLVAKNELSAEQTAMNAAVMRSVGSLLSVTIPKMIPIILLTRRWMENGVRGES